MGYHYRLMHSVLEYVLYMISRSHSSLGGLFLLLASCAQRLPHEFIVFRQVVADFFPDTTIVNFKFFKLELNGLSNSYIKTVNYL